MTSLIILFLGTFWEASMDTIGSKRNYDQSWWKVLADYFDRKNLTWFGKSFWDSSIAWSNKWKNHDPAQGEAYFGSSTMFVTLTDGWHVVKFFWLMHLFFVIILFERITDYFIIDVLILYGVFGLGHEVFWYLLKVKQHPQK